MSLFAPPPPPSTYLAPLHHVEFGDVARRVLATLEDGGVKKPLLVVDANASITKAGEEIISSLQTKDCAIYTNYTWPISLQEVKDGLAVYLAHECDGIVVIGGGSSIDLAKLIGLLACNNNSWSAFFYNPKAGRGTPMLICVPTSIGGSESSTEALVVDFSGPLVRDISREFFVPHAVFYDERFLETLPKKLVVANLLTMMVHLLENHLKGDHNEGMFRSLGALLGEMLAGNTGVYGDMQAFSLAMGKIYRTSGRGFLSSLSQTMMAFTGVPMAQTKAVFLPAYIRYEMHFKEVEALAVLFGFAGGQQMLDELEALIDTYGLRDELLAAKAVIIEKETTIAGQGALAEEALRDQQGIDPRTLQGLMRQVLGYKN